MLYLCDPEKYPACNKASCYYNTSSPFRTCFLCHKAEQAMTDPDGNPVRIAENISQAIHLKNSVQAAMMYCRGKRWMLDHLKTTIESRICDYGRQPAKERGERHETQG